MPHGTLRRHFLRPQGRQEAATALWTAWSLPPSSRTSQTCAPACCTGQHHAPPDDRRAIKEAGVSPDLIRLSVGIENPEDILDDIKQALEKAAQ